MSCTLDATFKLLYSTNKYLTIVHSVSYIYLVLLLMSKVIWLVCVHMYMYVFK